MIPSLVIFSWRRNQRIPVCIPLIVLWPLAIPVLIGTWIVELCAPRVKENAAKIRLMIGAMAQLRGLRIAIESDGTFLHIKVV